MTVVEACVLASDTTPTTWPVAVFQKKILRSDACCHDELPTLAEACVWLEHAPSLGQARTAIKGNGIRVNGKVMNDPSRKLTVEDVLHMEEGSGWIVVSKGKYGHAQLFVMTTEQREPL